MNRYYLRRLIAYTLLLIAIGCMLNSCSVSEEEQRRIKEEYAGDYSVFHYTDTINNKVILTTIVSSNRARSISVSTIEIENLNK